MCVDTHVSGGACQALVLPVRYMLVGFGIDILLRQPKVDDMDGVLRLTRVPSNQEVLWFDVAVDEVFIMYIFYSVKLWEQA